MVSEFYQTDRSDLAFLILPYSHIGLFPNGISQEENGYISLFLRSKEIELQDFDVNFTFGISSKKKDFVGEKTDIFEKTGIKKFMLHETLFNPDNEYISNGNLAIFCDVRKLPITNHLLCIICNIFQVKVSVPIVICESCKYDKVFNDFSKLFFNDKMKDCELHMKSGKILRCHKIILAARSPVFEAMFADDMEEARTGIVKIEDFNSKTMRQLLRFAYCLEVADLEEIAHDLMYAADKYGMEGLKEKCLESLILNLATENVLRSLIIADQISGTSNLFDECLNVIAR